MPLVINMSKIDYVYLMAKLIKIFESEGVLTEEIQDFHRKQIQLKIANSP